MISNKKTIAISAIAIAAVITLFATGPLVAAHQAQAYRGGWGGGFHRGFGFGGGFFPGWGWGGGWGGCGPGWGSAW